MKDIHGNVCIVSTYLRWGSFLLDSIMLSIYIYQIYTYMSICAALCVVGCAGNQSN